MTPINDFIKNYANGTNCEKFAVAGPHPFSEQDIIYGHGKPRKLTDNEVRMMEWLDLFMKRLGKRQKWLRDVPVIAMLKFWRDYHLKGKRRSPPLKDVYLIIEAKTDRSPYYWQTRIPGEAFTLNYGKGDSHEDRVWGFKNVVDSMNGYVCRKIAEVIDPLRIKKFTAYVTDAQVSPKDAGAKWSACFIDLPVNQMMFVPGMLAFQRAALFASMNTNFQG